MMDCGSAIVCNESENKWVKEAIVWTKENETQRRKAIFTQYQKCVQYHAYTGA